MQVGAGVAARPIFGIFEGGGAKGVAHVGALAACEENGFYFVGVAGASAGAIIATLIAAGLSASDILDPSAPQNNILQRYGETPLSLLGRAEWQRGQDLVAKAKVALGNVAKRRPLRSLCGLWRIKAAILEAVERNGYLSTAHAREVLNQILRDQLAFLRADANDFTPPPERIRFKDLDPDDFAEFRPLKIIAANVDTQELVIFDRDRTPEMEIALAVVASMAIPGVFMPVGVPRADGLLERHMDGGAVSNLPVWAFTNDKLAFERGNPAFGRVPTVGFTLKATGADTPAARDLPAWLQYLQRGLTTALSGSQSVIEEYVEDLRVIPLHSQLGTLAFDAGQSAMVDAYLNGRRCADRDLKHYLIDYPQLMQRELESFHGTIRKALIQRRPKGKRRQRVRLRTCIVQRFDGDVFRVTAAHNMDLDADDRLTLDARGRASPRAFLEREIQFLRVWGAAAPSAPGELDFMTKYERALANKTVRAIIATPIFQNLEAWDEPDALKRPVPCGVLAFDSDRDDELERAFNDPQFMSLLRAQSTLLFPVLTTEPSRG